MVERLTSRTNRRVKALVRLQQEGRTRRQAGQFCLEQLRELTRALACGFQVIEFYYCPELAGDQLGPLHHLLATADGVDERILDGTEVSAGVLRQISYRDHPSGWVAVMAAKITPLADLMSRATEATARHSATNRVDGDAHVDRAKLGVSEDGDVSDVAGISGGSGGSGGFGGGGISSSGGGGVWLVCSGIEKPGNVGAMLRTADAAGVAGVLIEHPDGRQGSPTSDDDSTDTQKTTGHSCLDLFHPHTVRASTGAVFHLPIATGTRDELIAWLQHHQIKIAALTVERAVAYDQIDWAEGPYAIVMGAEDRGVDAAWRAVADPCVTIPMAGQVDSMNVSVAAGIVLFEAVRWRRG